MATYYPDKLNAEVCHENANSYCDLDYANSYFENHFSTSKNTAWSALSDGQKIQALIQACWTLEQIRFTINNFYRISSISPNFLYTNEQGKFLPYPNTSGEPEKYFYYQALQFPRNRDITIDGEMYIPDRIFKAQCEQAIYLTSFDDSAISNSMQGISLDSIAVDKIKLTQEYTKGSIGSTLAPMALDYLKPYIVWNQRVKRA